MAYLPLSIIVFATLGQAFDPRFRLFLNSSTPAISSTPLVTSTPFPPTTLDDTSIIISPTDLQTSSSSSSDVVSSLDTTIISITPSSEISNGNTPPTISPTINSTFVTSQQTPSASLDPITSDVLTTTLNSTPTLSEPLSSSILSITPGTPPISFTNTDIIISSEAVSSGTDTKPRDTTEPTSSANTPTETPSDATTTSSASTTTTLPTPITTPFPTYIVPTTTVSGVAETSAAIEVGPLLFYLWTNRDWIQDNNHKQEYVDNVEETRNAVLGLLKNLPNQPNPPSECSQTSLKKRSLISSIINELNTIADLISCAVQVVDSLVKAVKEPIPPINVISILTDTLNDIKSELEKKDDEKQSSNPSQTQTSTEISSCTASSVVPSCTETITLSTSFLIVGTSTTSAVETLTTTVCTTVTECSATGTTARTTFSTATTSSETPVCEYTCGSDGCQATGGQAEPTGAALQRRHDILWKRALKDKEAITDKGQYVHDLVGDSSGQLDWAFAKSDAVSADFTFTDTEALSKSIKGLVGCTGIIIASKRGFWYTHLMQPGFLNRNDIDRTRWTSILDALRNGYDGPIVGGFKGPMKAPATLADEGGILENTEDNSVHIYVSTPSAGEELDDDWNELPRRARYADKIQEILNLLRDDDNAPFANAVVTQRFYDHPTDGNSQAIGEMLFEYDPTGLESGPGLRAYRVWMEDEPYEFQWAAACSRNQKRDGACTPSQSTSTTDTPSSSFSASETLSGSGGFTTTNLTPSTSVPPTTTITIPATSEPGIPISYCASSTQSLHGCFFEGDMGICSTMMVCASWATGTPPPPPTTTPVPSASCVSTTTQLSCSFVEDMGICETSTLCALWGTGTTPPPTAATTAPASACNSVTTDLHCSFVEGDMGVCETVTACVN